MPSRLVRSATAVALASSATTFAYVGSAAPAQAAGYNGYCKTSSGVTVVVDFRNLGGGIAIRCSPVGSGATGIDALQAAGIPVQGTRQNGLSVPCRIYGKPTATQELPGGYHEQCVRMPPGNAYWSYWHAPNGGSWSYSQEGAGSSSVISGGFEGWSFAEGSASAPRAAASRPAAPKPPPTHTTTQPPAPPRHTTTTAPTHDPAPSTHDPAPSKHDGGAPAGSQPKSTTASKAAEKKSKSAKGRAGKSAARSASSAAKSSHSSSSSAAGSSGSTSASSGAAAEAGGQPLSNSDDLIKDSKKKSSSTINATTVVGGGVLAALAIGGGVVAIIRRRNLG